MKNITSSQQVLRASQILAIGIMLTFFCSCRDTKERNQPRPTIESQEKTNFSAEKVELVDNKLCQKGTKIPVTGEVCEYYDSKKPLAVMRFTNGKPDGKSTFFHENGQTSKEAYFKDGLLHGKTTVWSESGQKTLEHNYAHGLQHGIQRLWREDGTLMLIQNYLDGEEHGEFVHFLKDGKILSRQNYSHGLLHGLSTIHSEDGKILIRQNYVYGNKQ